MVVRRGEVWWVDMPEPNGSGPGYRRPVIIVSSDLLNSSRIPAVMAVAISSNLRLIQAPGNVPLHPEDTGLPRPSVANVSQVLTLDRSQLDSRVRVLPEATMAAIDEGLRLTLACRVSPQRLSDPPSRE